MPLYCGHNFEKLNIMLVSSTNTVLPIPQGTIKSPSVFTSYAGVVQKNLKRLAADMISRVLLRFYAPFYHALKR